MTLSFSTQHADGTPTLFVAKIWRGLLNDKANYVPCTAFRNTLLLARPYQEWYIAVLSYNDGHNDHSPDVEVKPKIHTIRRDFKKRWRVGNTIHAVINHRTKHRFQFVPPLTVRALERIVIDVPRRTVHIENIPLSSADIDTLAQQDGFDTTAQFWAWFAPHIVFEGIIIHWTSFRYVQITT